MYDIQQMIVGVELLLGKLNGMVKHDKLLHFFYGYWIFIIVSVIGGYLIGLVFISVLAGLKEWYDSSRDNHTSDIMDFIYTVSSGLSITIFNYMGFLN